MTETKVVFFDVGNVLFNINYSSFLIERGISEKDVISVIDESFCGKLSDSEALKEIAEHSRYCDKNPFHSENLSPYIFPNVALFEYICQMPKTLSLGIISDMWALPYEWIMKEHDQRLGVFDKELIFFSNKTGISKQICGRDAFTIIARKTCLNADELLFIDDSPAYVEAAINAGWSGLCCPPFRRQPDWAKTNKNFLGNLSKHVSGKVKHKKPAYCSVAQPK